MNICLVDKTWGALNYYVFKEMLYCEMQKNIKNSKTVDEVYKELSIYSVFLH